MFKRGSERIKAVIGQMLKVQVELEKGIEEITGDINTNQEFIESAQEAGRELSKTRTQATKVLANVRKLLS